jgi:hypothetical protein
MKRAQTSPPASLVGCVTGNSGEQAGCHSLMTDFTGLTAATRSPPRAAAHSVYLWDHSGRIRVLMLKSLPYLAFDLKAEYTVVSL